MSPTLFASIVAAAIIVCVLAILTLVYLLLRVRHESLLQRRVDPQASTVARDFGVVGTAPVIETMARSGKAIEKMIDTEGESGRLMVQAGWRTAKARLFWYAFQAVMPVLLFAGVAAFWTFSESPKRGILGLLLLIIAAILSFLAPRWVLRAAASRRRLRAQHEVPLFIHLLVLLFESGLSTRQALASIVRESGGVLPELGHEFDIVLRQVDAGGELGEALKTMADMLEVEDLTTVLGVLRQVERYGGELREPLLETLQVIEERRGFELREKVNQLSGRMTVVMVMFFFPGLLIFVAGPAFLAIITALKGMSG
ncbi:type II secretion system F family protein [Solimonas terrae]|uniref:Type II secretion system F family protein n=1 Tax=Solimonas terrae TaxID=1396819 RepID=A0A6M2BSI4_9GAMM|nr:type II secretion system F family protein [Solimonas terrae]NGY05290.1 type II secretion system F family protein [Solimonas terrae]